MPFCAKCGVEVSPDAQFCMSCGTGVKPAHEETREPATELFCPHCGAAVSPPPRSKRKCPSCAELMLPRTLLDGTKALLTPEQADDLNRQKAELAGERQLVERLEAYGVNKQERREIEAQLQQRWGSIPSKRDVAWTAANRKLTEAAQQDDLQRLANIYWQMALQLYDEGRDHFKLSQMAKKYELLAMQREEKHQPYKVRVRVLGVCPESRALEGRRYTIEEALEEMPIPRADCTWQTSARGDKSGPGWCACAYTKELQF
jgi:hypothetical protein